MATNKKPEEPENGVIPPSAEPIVIAGESQQARSPEYRHRGGDGLSCATLPTQTHGTVRYRIWCPSLYCEYYTSGSIRGVHAGFGGFHF